MTPRDRFLAAMGAAFDALVEAVAAAAQHPAPAPPPDLATAKHNPLGSPRAFLDAARRGAYPSYRRGREVVARWEDVAAYDRARLRPRATREAAAGDPAGKDQAILRALRKAGALDDGGMAPTRRRRGR
jgi:hypothetical protein